MNQTFAKFINGSFFYEYPCTVSTECHPIETTLSTGFWKLECWGASGGYAYNHVGNFYTAAGPGGYSVGVIRITEETKILIYIGGQGISNSSDLNIKGGYNGGGDGYSNIYTGASGGGGTDIRTDDDKLSSRVIVAGGGGGAGVGNLNSEIGNFGGPGGGIAGLNGGGHSSFFSRGSGEGGNQTHGGEQAQSTGDISEPGEEWKGGNAGKNTDSSGGGGGGGYYGGSGGAAAGGGGGSGYIDKVQNFFSIRAQTIDGNHSFPSPFEGIEKGHIGNGAVKITYVKPSMFCTIYCKSPLYFIHSFLFFITILKQ